jgi:hypothetical protein
MKKHMLVQSDEYRNRKFLTRPFGGNHTPSDVEAFLEELKSGSVPPKQDSEK